MSEYSEQTRRDFKAGDDARDAGLTTPNDVVRFDDIPYGSDSPLQRLDVYRPRRAEGKVLPVIVNVHGGAWVYGTKEVYQFYCMSLAQRGFAVVNFSYRLAPEWKYPAGIEDTNAVFRWVLDHAAEYGLDAGHVFAVGDSAGAHMLAIYCCICTNPDYAARYAFAPPEGFVPTAVALNCGAYAFSEPWQTPALADLLPEGGTQAELSLIRPLSHVTPAFPPCLRDDRQRRLPEGSRAADGRPPDGNGGALRAALLRRQGRAPAARVPLRHALRGGRALQRRGMRLVQAVPVRKETGSSRKTTRGFREEPVFIFGSSRFSGESPLSQPAAASSPPSRGRAKH